MCLILEIPATAERLSIGEFADVAIRNPDGFTVIRTDDAAVLYRGLDVDLAWQAYDAEPTGVVIHWRKRTSGPVDDARCHGWRVGGVRLLHNGVLSIATDAGHSDTTTLVRRLAHLRVDLTSPDGQWLLEQFASRQAFCLIPATGGVPVWIGNDPLEHRGRFYSNTYAWSASTHGYSPPTKEITRSYKWDAHAGQGAWEWASDVMVRR